MHGLTISQAGNSLLSRGQGGLHSLSLVFRKNMEVSAPTSSLPEARDKLISLDPQRSMWLSFVHGPWLHSTTAKYLENSEKGVGVIHLRHLDLEASRRHPSGCVCQRDIL